MEKALSRHPFRIARVDGVQRHRKDVLEVEEETHRFRDGVSGLPVPRRLRFLILHEREQGIVGGEILAPINCLQPEIEAEPSVAEAEVSGPIEKSRKSS